jgi:CBS domain-containing protein
VSVSKSTLRDVMTPDPIVLDGSATASDAARAMKARDVGDVLVRSNGELLGIVTDRDLVVRALANGSSDVGRTPLAEICTNQPRCLAPDAEIGEAIALMEDQAIRRIPIVTDGRPVGIVSIGDLARAFDRDSALGKISAAPPSP